MEILLRAAFDAAASGAIVCDESGQVLLVNARLSADSGWSSQELIGQRVDKLLSGFDIATEQSACTLLHRDQSSSKVVVRSRPLRTPDGVFVFVSLLEDEELTARRLEASLKEKDALLREVHHRVKNNLQLISSLLKLQSRYCKDPYAKGMFEQSQSRVASIAAVHDRIYFGADLAHIPFDKYLGTLTAQWPRRPNLRITIESEPISLPVDLAIPCGLIVNELVLNALQHAFPEGQGGTIRVEAQQERRTVSIRIADDGVGLGPDIVVGKTGTFGLELVSILLRQLRGVVEIARPPGQGTSFTVRFELRA